MAGPLVGPLLVAVTAACVGVAALTTTGSGAEQVAALPGIGAVVAEVTKPAAVAGRPNRGGSTVPLAPAPRLLPPPGKAFFGIATAAGPYDLRQVDRAAQAAGRRPHVLLFSQDWKHDRFDATRLAAVRKAGLVPMVAWEPWDGRRGGTTNRERATQPDFRLADIAAGRHDAYVRSWARGLRDLRAPVALRFAHEMNGDWYPWAEGANGNRPGDYVRAWRHVHDVFAREGATNVQWVWSPNIVYPGSYPMAGLYPGDAYVDVVGVVGYFGAPRDGRGYPTFEELFGPTLAQVRALTRRPVVLTETGGTEDGGHKAAWTRELFAGLKRNRDIVGFVWFDVRKEADWPFTSSPQARQAFAQGVADPRFTVVTPAGRLPR